MWRIGLRENITRLLPGEVIRFSHDGLEKVRCTTDHLRPKEANIHGFEEALELYHTKLYEAIKKRIPELEQVGVIFSGGVDSVLIAAIAKELGANLTCYTAGTKNSADSHGSVNDKDAFRFSLCRHQIGFTRW